MCQRISDRNKFHTFSLEKEYDKLDALFHDRRVFCFVREASIMLQCAKPNISYYNCIQNMFLDRSPRGSFTPLEEMMEALAISVDNFADSVTEERLLDYIQFIANAIVHVDASVQGGAYAVYCANKKTCDALVENCFYILEHVGAQMLNEGKN